MLRLKSLPFFSAPPDSVAQSFIVPTNGFCISVPTRHGLDNYHGPGTIFQGQLNLQLAKPIKGPCRLRVIFSCLHTIPSADIPSSSSQSSSTSSSVSAEARLSSESAKHGQGLHSHHTLFEIEHVLVEDEPLHVRRHAFMFNIKFPKVNMPPSMTVSCCYSPCSPLLLLTVLYRHDQITRAIIIATMPPPFLTLSTF